MMRAGRFGENTTVMRSLVLSLSLCGLAYGNPAVAELALPSLGKQGCRALERTLFSGTALGQGEPFGAPLSDWTASDFDQIRSAMRACNRLVFSDSASELRVAQGQTDTKIDDIEKSVAEAKADQEEAAIIKREAADAAAQKKEAANEGETLLRRAEAVARDTEAKGETRLEVINAMLAELRNWSKRSSRANPEIDIYGIETELMAKQSEAEKEVKIEKRFRQQVAECAPLFSKAGLSKEISNSKIIPGEFGDNSTVGLFLCPFLKASDDSEIKINAEIDAVGVEFGANELRLERRAVRDGYWRSAQSDASQPFVLVYGRLGEKESKINNEGVASVYMMLSTQYLLNEYGPSVLE